MNIKVLFCVVLALAIIPCGLSFGSIGVDGQFLTNGDVTWIEDNDLETLFSQPINPDTGNPYTDTLVREGSRLLAIAEFPDFRNATTGAAPYAMFNTSTEMLTVVQYYGVASSTNNGGTWTTVFTPLPASDWLSDLGLTINSDDTFVAAYNDPISSPFDHVRNTNVPIGVTSASEGTLMYEFGFTYDAAGALEPGQFAQSVTNSEDFLVVAGINGLLTSTIALNQTFADPAATELVKHNFLGQFFPVDFTDPVYLQATSRKGNEANINTFWPLGTDTDGYLRAVVPEPATVLVWLVLACCGGAFCYRHKRARA